MVLDDAQMAPATWRGASLAAAQRMASRLVLVRVVVPRVDAASDPERRRRRQAQLSDVFGAGRLLPSHESARTHALDLRLGASRGVDDQNLYFLAGRAHPRYGDAVFVLRSVGAVEEDATPFGTGALLCGEAGPDVGIVHGGCLASASHQPETEQRAFFAASRWSGEWRGRAGEFLAAYYGDAARGGLARYFDDAVHMLDLPGPYAIYQNATQTDFSARTVEVRVKGEVDLNAALNRGELVAWGVCEALEAELLRTVERKALPFYERLAASQGIAVVRAVETDRIARDVDALARSEALS